MMGRLHAGAGIVALLTILSFWTATVISEWAGDAAGIVAVKQAILWGMAVLIPTMIAVGVSGAVLAKGRRGALIARKQRRMPVIALNGLLILVPCAIFLAAKAEAGQFDSRFVVVQIVELVAGGVNLVLISLNLRDGLSLSRARTKPAAH